MADSKVHQFFVDMTCEGCSGAVKRVLGKIEADASIVEIDLPNKKVVVASKLSADELTEVLKKTGKAVEYIGAQ